MTLQIKDEIINAMFANQTCKRLKKSFILAIANTKYATVATTSKWKTKTESAQIAGNTMKLVELKNTNRVGCLRFQNQLNLSNPNIFQRNS
jgi:hypothetical protein